MKIAFVIDKIRFSIPLGIAYLSSVLKKANHEVDVFEIGSKPKRSILDISRFRPEIVGYTVFTGTQAKFIKFNQELKRNFSFYTILGGPHPTFFPQIVESPDIDAVCIGEGEKALVKFVQFVQKYKELPEESPNFWIKKNGKIFKNPLGPLIEDLDSLPFPDTKLFMNKFPILKLWKRQEILAHRGCPYKCSYCFNHSYNDLYRENGFFIYRGRSPENICAEIGHLRNFRDIKFVYFVDDVFTLDVKWLRRFSSIYRKCISIPFSINMRLDNCDEEITCLLKEAGCHLVYVSIESGNDYIRNDLLYKDIPKNTIIENIKILKESRIKILTENMVGIPGETYEMALETLKLNSLIKPNVAIVAIFTPYPGLRLTEYAIKNNYFNGNYNEIDVTYHHHSNLKFKNKVTLNKMLNLRCFFGVLSRNIKLLCLFEKFFTFKNNVLFRLIGDILDGYYLKKALPYKMKLKEILRLSMFYLHSYRS